MTIYALILMNTTYKITKILNSDVDQTIVLTPNILTLYKYIGESIT